MYINIEAVRCSNCCRHCEVAHEPLRGHLSRDEIRVWADGIRQEADRLGVDVRPGITNSETLEHPQWREILGDLGNEGFGRGFPTNGRQIARHPELIEELKDRGVEWLHLALGGGSPETHDAFTRRRGSLDDIVAAAGIAHEAGLHVNWAFFAYHPLSEIARMSDLARSISERFAAGRFEGKGGIDQGIYLVKPQGEGWGMEHLRPTCSDLAELPEWVDIERFARWSGAGCETEGELVTSLRTTDRQVGCVERGEPECGGHGLVACRNGDVYPSCHERTPAYLLGNLNTDGLGAILDRLHTNPPPAIAIRRRGLPELASTYGDPTSDRLHSGCSLCRTLINRALGDRSVPCN